MDAAAVGSRAAPARSLFRPRLTGSIDRRLGWRTLAIGATLAIISHRVRIKDSLPSLMSASAEISAIAKALRLLRQEAGMTQADAAAAAGITRQAWQNYESGSRQVILQAPKQRELARALGTSREMLLAYTGPAGRLSVETPANSRTELLQIEGFIAMDRWMAESETPPSPHRLSTIVRDPRFPDAGQWLALVLGDGLSRRGIANGDVIHFVDAWSIDNRVGHGDIVVVERGCARGRGREFTLGEIEITPAGARLAPGSAAASLDLRVPGACSRGEEVSAIRVRGLALQIIRAIKL